MAIIEMMMPAYAAAATTVSHVNVGTVTSGTAAIVVAQPATPAVNDIWIMVVQTSNQSLTVPTNSTAGTWTEFTGGSGPSGSGLGIAATSGSTSLRAYWHRWTTATGNVNVADSGDHQLAQIAAYRGVKSTGNPYSVINVGNAVAQGGAATGSAQTPTALQTSVTGCMILLFVADGTDNATSTMNISTVGSSNTGTVNQRIRTNIATQAGGGIGLSDATVTAISTNTYIQLSNTAGVNTLYFMADLAPS